jgi:hypothetical protein
MGDLLTEDARKVYEVFRQPKTLGTRPAILVIDVTYAFVGRKPEHIRHTDTCLARYPLRQ